MNALVSDPNPAVRELCAVLARRELPKMLEKFPLDVCDVVKAHLLQALGAADCTPSMRRKMCDTVGRVGAEYHASGAWPELNAFIAGACGAGEPAAHEAALTIMQHMAGALVDSWAQCGASVHQMLTAALAPGNAPTVQSAALCALTQLLVRAGEREGQADNNAYRKQLKAMAAGLACTLPAMLAVLEGCINAADATRAQAVIDNLCQVAGSHPRLFKPVLAQVVEGMVALSAAQLPSELRITCVELLLTVTEGAPKMCKKMGGHSGRLLGALLPMMLRIEEDPAEWEEMQPEDGLNEGDEDEEGSVEAVYAQQGLDRLCTAMGGEEVGPLVLAHLQASLAGGGTWQAQHAAMIAVAQISEHAHDALVPHLGALVALVGTCAAAAQSRVRWAARYCVGLLADDFAELAEEHHAALVPHVTNGLADGSARVQAASALAAVNLLAEMPADVAATYAQPIGAAVHALLGAAGTPGFVVFSCAVALSMLCTKLGKTVAATPGFYAGFMPLLTGRLQAAVAAKKHSTAQALVEAIGQLAHAAGAAAFETDAATLLPGLLALLRQDDNRSEEYLDVVHGALARLGEVLQERFEPCLTALLPQLLAGVALEVDIEVIDVEQESPDDDDAADGVETTYITKQGGKGLVRMRISSAQMGEKAVALRALAGYAEKGGARFMPFVEQVLAGALPQLTYKWSDTVRSLAAEVVSALYKAVVLAAAGGAGGVGAQHVAQVFGAVVKPMNEALNKEQELGVVESLLDGFHEMIELEKTHKLGVLQGPHINAFVEVVRNQLLRQDARVKERAAEVEEDDDGAEEDLATEWNVLCTAQSITRELLELHGAALCPALEAQLCPTAAAWLTSEDPVRTAIALILFAHMLELGGRDNAKKYTLPILQLSMAKADPAAEADLRQSAVHCLGVVAEHSGKLLNRTGQAQAAQRIAAILQAPDARAAANLEASEAAVRALGKLLVHRAAGVDSATLLPLWLSWLPIKSNEEDGKDALKSLLTLLEGDAAAVLGADGGNLPQVLTVMGRAYEADATGEELSQRLRGVLAGWKGNEALMQACTAAMPEQPVIRERLARMVS